jgi:hypothetical protein
LAYADDVALPAPIRLMLCVKYLIFVIS